jgi:hypothetical protein
MPRSTSNVVWTVVVVVLVFLGLAASEKVLAALDRELPFEPPEDGLVREDRLLVFLDVEDDLRAQSVPGPPPENEQD